MSKKKVILFGPSLNVKNAFYGGGSGGYTRNMKVYLDNFHPDEFQIIPFFHTIRLKSGFRNNFMVRILLDLSNYIFTLLKYNPKIVHILAQYRSAMPREFLVVLLSRLVGTNIVYEIKAGMFKTWYKSTNGLNRWMTRVVLKHSRLILVEGKPYINFVKEIVNKESYYFPNFVPVKEIPTEYQKNDIGEYLKVFFIGYCYKGKGIFELIDGLNLAAKDNIKIELTIAGNESPEFTNWIDHKTLSSNLRIRRLGMVEHETVLNELEKSNIFCLPSRHVGEGHNNSVNEAMMLGKCVICTKHGFLQDIIEDQVNGILIEKENTIDGVYGAIKFLNANKELISEYGRQAYEDVKKKYSTHALFPLLEDYYKTIS